METGANKYRVESRGTWAGGWVLPAAPLIQHTLTHTRLRACRAHARTPLLPSHSPRWKAWLVPVPLIWSWKGKRERGCETRLWIWRKLNEKRPFLNKSVWMSLGLVVGKVARELWDTHIGWMDQRGEQCATLVLVKVRVELRRSFVSHEKATWWGTIAHEWTGTSVCNRSDRLFLKKKGFALFRKKRT